jgi:hypothetical protein
MEVVSLCATVFRLVPLPPSSPRSSLLSTFEIRHYGDGHRGCHVLGTLHNGTHAHPPISVGPEPQTFLSLATGCSGPWRFLALARSTEGQRGNLHRRSKNWRKPSFVSVALCRGTVASREHSLIQCGRNRVRVRTFRRALIGPRLNTGYAPGRTVERNQW